MTETRVPLGRFLLTSDGKQWVLVRERVATEGKQQGETVDSTIGYFSHLGAAIYRAAEQNLRESGSTTVEELHDELIRFRADCDTLLDPWKKPQRG